MNADVEKAVERLCPEDGEEGCAADDTVAAWRVINQALRDQEAEIDRLRTNENLSDLQYNRMLAKYEGAESRAAKAEAEVARLRKVADLIPTSITDPFLHGPNSKMKHFPRTGRDLEQLLIRLHERITAHLGASHG